MIIESLAKLCDWVSTAGVRPDAVEAATGIRPALPARMADLFDRPERMTRVENDLGAIETLIREALAK